MGTAVITGANRGIGLELCRQLKARGNEIIAVCRNASDGLRHADFRIIDGIDVTDGESVAELADKLGDQRIDLLINNAGILRSESFGSIDYETMVEQYRVNALGPLRVTEALSDHLQAGAKVIIISSRVGSIEDNGSGGNYGYRASKAAVNMIGTNLRHELGPRGIAVGLLHPGLVATRMTGEHGISVGESVAGLVRRIDELTLETSGGFWHAEGYRLPW